MYTGFINSFVKLPLNQKTLGILEVEKASESVQLLYNFWHVVGVREKKKKSGTILSVVNMGRNGKI